MVNSKRCFIIAEAGVNHNGSLERAIKLVESAARSGADAVKFQSFCADLLVSPDAAKADYQIRRTGNGDQLSMLRGLELDAAAHRSIAEHCRRTGIEFMSTPFDEKSARMLVELGVLRIKVPSGELTNLPFLEYLCQFDLPLILSTGMATLEEVKQTVGWIAKTRHVLGMDCPLAERLTLLHCTSNYPASLHDVNLRAMKTMRDSFALPVGYSDHTLGIVIATAAAACGATIIEKHLTLDRSLPGPDHQASLEEQEFTAMVSAIRDVEVAMGDGCKVPTASELHIRDVARRSIALARDVPAGQPLERGDLVMLRPGTGISPVDIDSVLGRSLARDLKSGSVIRCEDLR